MPREYTLSMRFIAGHMGTRKGLYEWYRKSVCIKWWPCVRGVYTTMLKFRFRSNVSFYRLICSDILIVLFVKGLTIKFVPQDWSSNTSEHWKFIWWSKLSIQRMLLNAFLIINRDSSVMTGYGFDSCRSQEVFYSPPYPGLLWGPPSLLSNATTCRRSSG